ncbi:MAG: FAD-dependent oxidoreductase [Thermodesulfobacteriota bacterium]
MVTLNIDGLEVTAPEGTALLTAAARAGIFIPCLCFHPDLPPVDQLAPAEAVHLARTRVENKRQDLYYEGCRLCVVEIEGRAGLAKACLTPVEESLIVHTTGPEIEEYRRDRLMFLLAKHPHVCLTCAQKEGCARYPCSMDRPELERCCSLFGRCEFQKTIEYVGLKPETPRYLFKDLPRVQEDPLFDRDNNLCIGCTRCIRVCRDVRGVEALGFVFDEEGRLVVGPLAPTLPEAACRFCTACVEVCPTGALMDKEPFDEAPCRKACPVGIDVPRYVALIGQERFDEAYAVVREKLPLPSVCSYICLSFCEEECRRGELNDPVAIRALKRFVSENHSDLWKKNLEPPPPTGRKVAIVGSGPAGLTAGYYLARKGHQVTMFEQASSPGGMLRQAISRKRLPPKALEEDLAEILQAGVDLKLKAPQVKIGDLFGDNFDAVFLATGSTFSGPTYLGLKEEGIAWTGQGGLAVDLETLATGREGVFAGGDAILGGISEDFIRLARQEKARPFYDALVRQLVLHRGDSSRSALRAIASGKKAARRIDRYLGGDGEIEKSLLPPEPPSPWLGRLEGFAGLGRLAQAYQPPLPQFPGLSRAQPPLSPEESVAEARRCLRCDLRLLLSKPIVAPRKRLWTDFVLENLADVPEKEGVYQLLDENESVIYIKGAMNLRRELGDQLELRANARFFMFELEQMYAKRESEILQQYMAEHGQMPEGNRELDDLF